VSRDAVVAGWGSSPKQAAVRGERHADVPCGGCVACCTSSQFVHVGPDEHDTLARIPVELLVPAPGLPAGHQVMGYGERGHCPMLVDGACSVYEHRPRTCRTYDCRVFRATGIEPDAARPAIIARAARWRFDHPTVDDQRLHDACRAAAALLAMRAEPLAPTRRAVAAIELHQLFLDATPEPAAVDAALAHRRR
jgi:Fe-S-cluster containining protein